MFRIHSPLLVGLVVALCGGQSADAFELKNNSTKTVWVVASTYTKGWSQPDYVEPHWITSGWWKVPSGKELTIDGGDSDCYIRLTYDTDDGELIVPKKPNGKPIGLLTHQSKFRFERSEVKGVDTYGLYIDNKSEGTHPLDEAVAKKGCKIRDGFYKYEADTTFTVGGDKPPLGTVRTASFNFEHKAGALKSNNFDQTYDIPKGATVVDYKVEVSSERGAIVIWSKEANGVKLHGMVHGENKPFGGGGIYKGTVTVTYKQ